MKVAIKRKDVLSYMFLPGIKPRLANFMKEGFSSLAFIIALIYNAVGILPSSHPYLKSSKIGQYGVRHVIIEAQKHLTFSFKHIDQIIIFFAIFFGIILLAVLFLLTLASFFAKSAFAGMPQNILDFLETDNPETDIAFRLLDMVFGVPGLFGSEELTYLNIFADFHQALHGMFIIYSLGIIVIGALIISYFIGAVLIETAQTGTPFGKRFNHVWVPVRIIVAFGLLIPIGFGMNAGQFVTLYAAKFGSGFATNGWIYFNQVVAGNGGSYIGNRDTLVAMPQLPSVGHYQSFVSLAVACQLYYNDYRDMEIDVYMVKGSGDVAERLELYQTDFPTALAFSGTERIHVKLGHFDPTYTDEIGSVKPLCGEMYLDIISLTEPGFYHMQEAYYYLMGTFTWADYDGGTCEEPTPLYAYTQAIGNLFVETFISRGSARDDPELLEETIATYLGLDAYGEGPETLDAEVGGVQYTGISHKELEQLETLAYMNSCTQEAQALLQASPTWNIDQDGLNLGWAGAAIWYNKLAQLNGGFVSVVQNLPRIYKYPWVMEYILDQKLQQDDNINPNDRFKPELEQGGEVKFQDPRDAELARVFNIIFQFWEEQGYASDQLRTHTSNETNAIVDAINAIFGTQGLFDMCKNTNIHPLAQLAALGKGLIEAAIQNLGYSLASGVMGGAAYVLAPHMGAALGTASGFFGTIAGIGLLVGFLLYYVIPFMPFLYFFFAVGGWLKGIFEAMVGVPLWALAHLRIDGEGLPGPGGQYGYFLIFEIFLRPFMIVMGLLASITIYAAMVRVLNDIFWLVVSNIAGHDPVDTGACTIVDSTNFFELGEEMYLRGPIDEFFFTVIYAIIVYMIGMSSFKLIDQIPNEIMRWLGANVKTFNDERGETAEGLVQRITVGGGALMGKLQGAAQQAGSAVSSGGQGLLKALKSGDNGGQ